MIQLLCGSVNEWGWCKEKLGGNAILAVSMAVCKAGVSVLKIPLYKHIANLAGNQRIVLPVPSFTVINRVSHAGNKLATQGEIAMKYGNKAVQYCDEGGFALNIKEKECLELLESAIDKRTTGVPASERMR
ncbi:enolase-like isoform X1 [Lotus japonicus]|uniref:enolase-like isoform X1 n=1 Tax=Lotus japonicus TaxID=34305 RepID=UPI00258FB242|nr:enolase-like isoform X1 [Lotus japonicus]